MEKTTGFEYSADQLTAIGGKVWEKADKKRVYFNEYTLSRLYGLEYSLHKTGMVSSATIDGDACSNSTANTLRGMFYAGKFFYDLISNEFVSYDLDNDVHDALVEAISEKTNGIQGA